MYAIAFDLDTATLENTHGSPSYKNAYTDIRRTLEEHGFDWQQGSVYFGGAARSTPSLAFLRPSPSPTHFRGLRRL